MNNLSKTIIQYQHITQMLKRGGIVRNKISKYREIKQNEQRKKTRFQAFYRDLDDGQSTDRHILIESSSLNALSTSTTLVSPTSDVDKGIYAEKYERAKTVLAQIIQNQNKIKTLTRNRLMTFKDSEIKKLDQSINQQSMTAMKHISTAQSILKDLRNSKSQNPLQQKFIRNIQKSLAFDIRQSTKNLRVQQKQFFDGIKNYQSQSLNPTLKLTQEQKQSIKDQEQFVQVYELLQKQRNQQINTLVTNINKLSNIYKQMNQLVIDQGSLIDRIDYNLEETVKHTKKGVEHLVMAEQHVSSPFADKVIKVMIGMILMMAMLLAYKYSK